MAKQSGFLATLGFARDPGAPVPHRKNTSASATEVMPVPATVTIAMSMHIGAPCTPCVKPKDHVDVGTVIGSSPAFMSALIHSSVSGTVKKVDSILMPNGSKTQAVVIDTDGQQTLDPSLKAPEINSKEDFLEAVKASGLVGLGGAGFPAHIKLNPATPVDILCINGAECEPYITADEHEFLENYENVIYGITQVRKYLGVEKVLIGIEGNKPGAIALMKEKTAEYDYISVVTLPARYPQGAEKVLIDQMTDRQVPPGKLPADVGTVVMNVASIGFLGGYLKDGIPLTTKRVTVDGSAITTPKNVRVLIGTPIKDIIDFCGGYKETPAKLISGGPMMGIALMTDDFPVLKQNNAFLAFNEKDAKSFEPTSCIRCGRCVDACPMNLMPTKLEDGVLFKDVEILKEYGVMNCMECGCCAFVCPANRKLVHAMKLGKMYVREAGQ
ncbi:MAG: electron transport complex subunit RsxC [Lachnospiraceae bacterium]|nr:electron transport complex subunit RsxC [Lachnospiraceae bacterium]